MYLLSVHWVADPDDRMTGRFNSLDVVRQMRTNLKLTKSDVNSLKE